MKTFDKIMLVAIVLGITTLLFPSIPLLLIAIIIGAPIGFLMMLTPGLAILLVLVRTFQHLLGGQKLHILTGSILALAILAVLPFWANTAIDKQISEITANDIVDLKRPLKAAALAIRKKRGAELASANMACDELCLRLLLNDQTDRVLMVTTPDLNLPVSTELVVNSFYIEKRPECPLPSFDTNSSEPAINVERRSFGDKDVFELARIRIAQGNCIIDEQVKLGVADTIISVGEISKGTSAYNAQFDLSADTVSAGRINILNKQDDNFVEIYRLTGVRAEKLAPILIPIINFGHGFEVKSGFLRLPFKKNLESTSSHIPNWTKFLTEVMQFDLGVAEKNDSQFARNAILSALDKQGALDPTVIGLIEDLFSNLSVRHRQNSESAEQELEVAIRALEDKRVTFPKNPWGIANRSHAPGIAHSKRIKNAIWMRLEDENLLSPRDTSGVATKMAVLYASLPNEAVSDDREKLEKLTKDPVRRVKLHSMLEQLAGFGPSSAKTFLYLMKDARKYRSLKPDPFGDLNSWQRPYLAGLIGLCKMGSADATTIRQLYAELDASFEGGWVGYDRLAISTLMSMGSSPEVIWEHAKHRKLDANFSAAQLRDEFDRNVMRAQSKIDCSD